MTVYEGSGNAFADIGCPNPEGMLAKAEIVGQIKDLVAKRVMSIRQAAEVTGVASSLLKMPYKENWMCSPSRNWLQ